MALDRLAKSPLQWRNGINRRMAAGRCTIGGDCHGGGTRLARRRIRYGCMAVRDPLRCRHRGDRVRVRARARGAGADGGRIHLPGGPHLPSRADGASALCDRRPRSAAPGACDGCRAPLARSRSRERLAPGRRRIAGRTRRGGGGLDRRTVPLHVWRAVHAKPDSALRVAVLHTDDACRRAACRGHAGWSADGPPHAPPRRGRPVADVAPAQTPRGRNCAGGNRNLDAPLARKGR